MEIRQVRHALALYEFGTFTRAAPEVGISQPALTESVRKLEDRLGSALFLRDGTGCRPTAFGKAMLPRFKRLAAEFDETLDAAQDFVQLRRVPLRIGVLSSIGMERLAPCLATHQREKPEIEIEVLTTTFSELRDGLGNGSYDIGIGSAGEIEGDLLRSEPLYEENYVVMFPRSHPFSEEIEISIKHIESQTLLDRPKCEMRDKLLKICSDADIDLYAPHRTNSVAFLKLQVQSGVGIAVLPRYSLEPDHPHLASRPLALSDFSRQVLALRRFDQVHRPETQALLDDVKRALRKQSPLGHDLQKIAS